MFVSFLGGAKCFLVVGYLEILVGGVGTLWNFALVKLHEAQCLFDDTLITHSDV
jgi:hypothetical protein